MTNATFSAGQARDKQDRRRCARRRDTYQIWCALGTKWVSAYGVDISASGLGLVAPVEISKDEVQLRAALDERTVSFRAKRVWTQPGTFRGQIVHRYGLKITGIAADDWDALVRYCSGGAEDPAGTSVTRLLPEDLARLIPYRVQRRMLSMLVERKRLAPLDGKTPLVQYAYAGKTEREGALLHRVAIHSRVCEQSSMQTRSFTTRFLFSEDCAIVTLDE